MVYDWHLQGPFEAKTGHSPQTPVFPEVQEAMPMISAMSAQATSVINLANSQKKRQD